MQPDADHDAALETFFSQPSRPEEMLSHAELRGFMFALACAPDLVKPSEWLPVIFGGDGPAFDTTEEAERVMAALMALHNDIADDVRGGAARTLAACTFLDDVLANLEPDAPVAQWARGFRVGHLWLEETWEAYLPDDWADELGAQLATLTFFSSRDVAEALAQGFAEADVTLEKVATTFQRLFPDAVRGYAAMGTAIWKARWERERERLRPAATATTPGRNQPCPCGSGRKFKKCCGRPVN
ncbi:MAG TPA: UPF0149 family protein [Longimicrobiales bacterium]|nr:UPF0149 family protein [Longimicrobiales bacterium]